MLESHSYDDVIDAALSLPEDQRLLIADALVNSVEPQSQSWRDDWREELARRAREFDANPSSGLSWDEVKANARRRAGLA
jgi:putative addiction module component (TIGR02574 family)